MNGNINLTEAKLLINNVVSRAWKGYGSALFLEVGEIIDEKVFILFLLGIIGVLNLQKRFY